MNAVTVSLAKAIDVSPSYVDLFLSDPTGQKLMEQGGQDEVAAIMAQIKVETTNFRPVSENLNYSAQALWSKFPKYFSQQDAFKFGRLPNQLADQKAIAERMYGDRMGNDGVPGRGWKYRGRGLIQTTGYNNYRELERLTGLNLLADPDLLLDQKVASQVTWVQYTKMGLQDAYIQHGIKGLSRALNLGSPTTRVASIHEDQRIMYYHRLIEVLSV